MQLLRNRIQDYRTTVFIILLLFALTRLLIYFLDIKYSDVSYYARIGYQSSIAESKGLTLYDFQIFEYPPLAALLIRAPNLLLDFNLPFLIYQREYTKYFRLIMMLFDCLSFSILFLTTVQLYGRSIKKIVITSTIYILGTLLLYNLIYDRLDLILMFFIICSFYFQIKNNYLISCLFLTTGVYFKLLPIILFPIWLLACAPDINFTQKPFWYKNNICRIVRPLAFIVATNILFLTVFLVLNGSKIFDFLEYHGSRGIQIESTYSTVIQIAHWFGLPYHIETSYGSQNIVSSWSVPFSKISPLIILAGILLGIYRFSKFHGKKVINFDNPFAVKYPITLLKFYLLFLFLLFTFSKVLSTQYFLIPLPFIALYLTKEAYGMIILWIFLMVITTLIFPYFYKSDVISSTCNDFTKPSLLGTTLLFCRNFLLIYFLYYFINDSKRLVDNQFCPFEMPTSMVNYTSMMIIITFSTLLLIMNLVC